VAHGVMNGLCVVVGSLLRLGRVRRHGSAFFRPAGRGRTDAHGHLLWRPAATDWHGSVL